MHEYRLAHSNTPPLRASIYICLNRTENECFNRMLFGLSRKYRERVLNTKKGSLIFLLNIQRDTLYGIFEAEVDGRKDIEPEAFNGRYPYQVKVRWKEMHEPLNNAKQKLAELGSHKSVENPSPQQIEMLTSSFRTRIGKPSTYGFTRHSQTGTYKTDDGHYVRSRGEVIIDNFLYNNGIPHSYEKRLPTESKFYSDFYLPEYDLYIEYWGLEGERTYEIRKNEKLKTYSERNLKLLEIHKDDIGRLTDKLTEELLRFNLANL